jgi:hypothetical protein
MNFRTNLMNKDLELLFNDPSREKPRYVVKNDGGFHSAGRYVRPHSETEALYGHTDGDS